MNCSECDDVPWWLQLQEAEREAYVQRGIFEPLFDEAVMDDADEEMTARDRANAEGDPAKRFRYLAEAQEAREQREAREKMILVERFIDELPETAEYLRTRAAAQLRRVEQVVRNDTVDRVESALFGLAGKLMATMMQQRMRELEAAARLGRSRGVGTNAVEEASGELLNAWVWNIRAFMNRLRPKSTRLWNAKAAD